MAIQFHGALVLNFEDFSEFSEKETSGPHKMTQKGVKNSPKDRFAPYKKGYSYAKKRSFPEKNGQTLSSLGSYKPSKRERKRDLFRKIEGFSSLLGVCRCLFVSV
jgi:hypothetical protein